MIWSPLTMTYTDNGREIGRIERIEKPDPYNDEFTVTRYAAVWFGPWSNNVGADFDTRAEAKAMIEELEGEHQARVAKASKILAGFA